MQRYPKFASVASALLALASSWPVGASFVTQNIDLMAKWTAATIVNYRVTAEFSGEALLFEAGGLTGRGTVTDRFEVEFDWNQTEFAMVGKPVIRNFPSTLVSLSRNGNCAITTTGAFEHATILEIRNDEALRYANAVQAEVQRELPAGTIPFMTEVGPCAGANQAAARTVKQQLALPAPQGMMLAMPSGQGGYTHNGKAFVIKAGSTEEKGWTYTVTPTIVK